MTTRPWSLLPAPDPSTHEYPADFFYENVAKPLIADTIRVMSNGLPIDLTKVQELEATLDVTLEEVRRRLASNSIVRSYLEYKYSNIKNSYIEEQTAKKKSYEEFMKPFKSSDMIHRSYFMHHFIQGKPIRPPEELLPTGIPKWTAKDVKTYAPSYLVLQQLLAGTLPETNAFVIAGMRHFAEDKAELHNRSIEANISSLSKIKYPEFNPASSDDKHYILVTMLGYESTTYTDAYKAYEKAYNRYQRYGGAPPQEPKLKYSWPRNELKTLLDQTSDPDEHDFFSALIDHSMGAIIKNNFIKAFYQHTHNGRLYGSYTLLGAKTGRYTSSDPNLQNMPSSNSIYAKPVKSCFIAPPGYVVWSIDYAALEDRVIASLSKDPNKCNLFLEGLDG